MFRKFSKLFFLKKNVNKLLQNQPMVLQQKKIDIIGVLVDESYFSNTSLLIDELINQGFKKEQLAILVYKDKIKAKETINEPFLSPKNISYNGSINKAAVVDFLETPFDLLINYYDVNKNTTLLLSLKSKANFKVGFDTIDKRVNQLIIKESIDTYKEFASELIKYLKILNKI